MNSPPPPPFPTAVLERRGLRFKVRVKPGGRDTSDLYTVLDVVDEDCYSLGAVFPAALDPVRDRAPAVIDLGGAIGAFGVLALSRRADARLLAFEPHPDSHALYQANLAANGFAGEVEPSALVYGDGVEWVVATRPGLEWSTVVTTRRELETRPEWSRHRAMGAPVRVTRLGDALRRHGLESIDLCKMDCEGGEWDMLAQEPAGLWSRVAFVVGEYHGDPDAFRTLLHGAFPRRPCALAAVAPRMGHFWVAPPGSERTVAEAELAFWKNYSMAETKRWKDRYRRLAGRRVVRWMRWLRSKLPGGESPGPENDGDD